MPSCEDRPSSIIDTFLGLRGSGRGPSLFTWRSATYSFDGGVWQAITEDDLEHELDAFLRTLQVYPSPTQPAVPYTYRHIDLADHLKHIKARTRLSSRTLIPARIGTATWAPSPTTLWFSDRVVDIAPDGSIGFHPNDGSWFFPATLPFDYDPDAPCPTWEALLQQWFNGCEASAELLERRIAYMLMPFRGYQCGFYDFGPPRAGKGLVDAVESALLGGTPNRVSSDISYCQQKFGRTGWDAARLIVFDEVNKSTSHNVNTTFASTVKHIVGGGAMVCPRKYQSDVDCVIEGIPKIISNDILKLTDYHDSFWGKMRFLHFPNSWLGRDDPTLEGRLTGTPAIPHGELPGIAARAVAAACRLVAAPADARWPRPANTQTLYDRAAGRDTPLRRWYSERLTDDEGAVTAVTDLYDDWRAWPGSLGLTSPNAFGTALRNQLGLSSRRGTGGVRVIDGLSLRTRTPE